MTWANQTRVLKQSFEQLSAIWGGALINAFKPFVSAMNVMMKKVIAFSETVTNALGAIFGWKFEVSGGGVADDWSDAAISADDIAGATGDASKNIDKMNKGIRKFDELNIINTSDKKKTSGSGSDDGASTGGASGGLVQVDTIFKDYESQIKNLEQLGIYIGNALSDAMESINWDSIYKKARNFGKGLADFLNGLISPRLFGNLGKTIAGALNTALHFLDSFGTTFDWSNFGYSLASGLNSFMKTYNWKTTLSASKNWGNGLATALNSFIEATSWRKMGETIANGINTAVMFTGSFLRNFNWKNLAQAVANTISSFFAKVDWKEFGRTLADALNAASSLFATFMTGLKWQNVASSIVKTLGGFLREVDWGEFAKAMLVLLAAKLTLNATTGIFKGAAFEIAKNIKKTISNEMTFDTIGSEIVKKIASGIAGSAAFKAISSAFSSLGSTIASAITSPVGAAITGVTLALGAFVVGLEMTRVDCGAMADDMELNFAEMSDVVKAAVSESQEALDSFNKATSEHDYTEVKKAADEYYRLSQNYSNLTDEEKTMMQTYYQIIQDSTPIAVLNIDSVTGAYKGTKDALDQLIDKAERYSIVQAAQESLKDVTKSAIDLQFQISQVSGSQEKAERVTQAWSVAYKNATGTNKTLLEKLKDVNFQVGELSDSEQEQLKSVLQTNEALQYQVEGLDSSTVEYLALSEQLKDTTAKQEYLTKIVSTGGESYVETSKKSEKAAKEFKDGHNAMARGVVTNNSTITSNNEKTTKSFRENWSSASSSGYLATKKFKDNSVKSISELKEHYSNAANKISKDYASSLLTMKSNSENTMGSISGTMIWKSSEIGLKGGNALNTGFLNGLSVLNGNFGTSLTSLNETGMVNGENIGYNLGDSIGNGLQSAKERIQNSFKAVTSGLNAALSIGASVGAQVKLPGFASGGYVPTRYSLFMAGEDGIPEIAGTVGGKTAVAGGAEITGIKDAVYDTAQQELAEMREQNRLLRALLDKEFGISQNEIGKASRNYAKEYYNRTGRPAYDF